MKNILYLHAGAEMYGADKILLEIVKGLDKEKFNPIVVLPTQGILQEKLKEANIETHIVEYPILRRKYFNIKGIINYIFSYHKQSKKILEVLKNKDIDIIHANTTAVLEGIYLKHKLRSKLVWHVHEIITTPKFMNLIISFLVGTFSDKVLTVSKAVANNLTKTKMTPKSKIKVLYNGVDNTDVTKINGSYLYDEFSVTKKVIKVGMIGRINAWKGQKDFVNAMAPIIKKNQQVHAFIIGGVFAGEEWRIEDLKKDIRETGVAENFHLSNFRSDVPQLLDFFDFFVLPSSRPDPLPTVVLEAMSMGKAVVSYRHGGATEMIIDGETGLLATPNSVDDLSLKIRELISNSSLREQMGQKALIRQRNVFNKKMFIANLEKIYEAQQS